MTAPSLEEQIREYRRVRGQHRCVHPDASRTSCSRQRARSHSLSRGRSLARIARQNHVYAPISEYGQFHAAGGRCEIRLQSIRAVSTFRGFCARHDSSTFRDLDVRDFDSTEQYAALFAYRAICHEVVAKRNGIDLVPFLRQMGASQREERRPEIERMLRGFEVGLRHGLANLEWHKLVYEELLRRRDFRAVRYEAFFSANPPNVLCSSVIYPDFDFAGVQIQDLARVAEPLDLLAFGALAHGDGTVALLVWHESSDRACRQLVGSLAQLREPDVAIPNALLHMLLCATGNLAIRPEWWESLPPEAQGAIRRNLELGASPTEPIPRDYLARFSESPFGWRVSYTQSNSRQPRRPTQRS